MSESQKVALKGVLFHLVIRALLKMCVSRGGDNKNKILLYYQDPIPGSKFQENKSKSFNEFSGVLDCNTLNNQ